MNIPESRGENCQDIIYDVIENDLKISVEEIQFHVVHRVGKPHNNGATLPHPRAIIARFAVGEKTGMLYLMSKTDSSPQPDVVKPISPKILLKKFRKKGKPLLHDFIPLGDLALPGFCRLFKNSKFKMANGQEKHESKHVPYKEIFADMNSENLPRLS